MFREIKKKKILLENRKPYTREVADYIEEMNFIDWIYTDLRLTGSRITKLNVEKIVKGEFLVDVSIDDHVKVGNHLDAIKMVYNMAEMSIELDEKYILKIYEAIAKPDKVQYRRTNPILLMMDYNPPHPADIEEQLDIMFQWMRTNDFESNPILKAAYLHNKIIEIYPFETHSEVIARIAMYYELILGGYPPILLSLSEQEYYSAIRSYLKKEQIQPIYEPLERGVYNKLEVMMQLTSN